MIRPFQLGDLLLVQRLGQQAAKLNIIQALLQPRPALMIALGAVLPWAGGKANTYILRQQKNSLAHAGFIQAYRRPGRAEADITYLAPALDMPWGHPAIWEKLLTHYVHEAASQNIYRLYADVPDQPLPVQSFTQSGFKIYTRQTIWRLNQHNAGLTDLPPVEEKPSYFIRPLENQDEWALTNLYYKVTPKEVQLAEGVQQEAQNGYTANGNSSGKHVKPVILEWWQGGNSQTYVLIENGLPANSNNPNGSVASSQKLNRNKFSAHGDVKGCILIGQSQSGYWLRLLVDTNNPDAEHVRALLRYGLETIDAASVNQPIYIGVRSYHGGLSTILSEYGFAPFTDLARMVRHVPLWIRTPVFEMPSVLKPVRSPVPTTYIAQGGDTYQYLLQHHLLRHRLLQHHLLPRRYRVATSNTIKYVYSSLRNEAFNCRVPYSNFTITHRDGNRLPKDIHYCSEGDYLQSSKI